jgi:hypothetical protein
MIDFRPPSQGTVSVQMVGTLGKQLWAAWKIYKMEEKQRGKGDIA